jgi:hypothetical protein
MSKQRKKSPREIVLSLRLDQSRRTGRWLLVTCGVLLAIGVWREGFHYPTALVDKYYDGYQEGQQRGEKEMRAKAAEAMGRISKKARNGEIPCKPGMCHFHQRANKVTGYCCYCGQVRVVDFRNYVSKDDIECGPFFPIDP